MDVVYARHGRELMGCKSPVCRIQHRRETGNEALADGKGVSARRGLKEARAQSYEPTNGNSIQGRGIRASQHGILGTVYKTDLPMSGVSGTAL